MTVRHLYIDLPAAFQEILMTRFSQHLRDQRLGPRSGNQCTDDIAVFESKGRV